MGAIWVDQKHADVLGPGTHGTTFGGTPLASAVGLAILDEVEREGLADNARTVGEAFRQEFLSLQQLFPAVIEKVRGLGLMLGVAFKPGFSPQLNAEQAVSIQMVKALEANGMLTIPAGANVVRFLPALNVTVEQAREAAAIMKQTINDLLV